MSVHVVQCKKKLTFEKKNHWPNHLPHIHFFLEACTKNKNKKKQKNLTNNPTWGSTHQPTHFRDFLGFLLFLLT